MGRIEERLNSLGLVLPQPITPPPGVILELFGAEIGAHSRSAIGMAELPFDIPVEIEGEVEIAP
jgi:hypothetical protein